MKILIAIPTYSDVEPEVMKAIYGLDRCGHNVFLDIVYGYQIDDERNRIAREALDGGYDYVFMVDADVVIPPNALRFLLEIPVPICSGIYIEKRWLKRNRTNAHHTNMNTFGRTINYESEDSLTAEQLIATGEKRVLVKGGGAGCLLVCTEVLRGTPEPWFRFVRYPDGDYLSEDLFFCEHTRAHGFSTYVDPRVECGHITKQTLYCHSDAVRAQSAVVLTKGE